jgi:signal transduction histidine kinase/DNA-binding response OmpR family regulator
MLGILKRHLANKILIAMVGTIVLIMGAEIAVRIYFGTRDRMELINMSARELASSTYAGMKHPMAAGDAKAIIKQMSDIEETAKGVEVFICDFEQEIVYSTHGEKVGTNLADTIHNQDAIETLSNILKTGVEPDEFFEDEVSTGRYFVYFYPILNQPDCYHCHGSSRKVLGSMAIRMRVSGAYETVAAQRNRTIVLTVLGVLVVILTTHIVVNRLIRRPVQELAEKAKRFAEGDTTVSMGAGGDDEIGILGRTFNYMVGCVSTAKRALEEEIKRKTALLDERARLIVLLEKANRELRNLDQMKSTFLANMSHELRTPMNAIIGYTDLLIDGVDGPINEEQEKSLTRIATNSRYLLQLINDILDISKIESGRMQLSTKEVDLTWVVDSVVATFEPFLKQKHLTLRTHMAEGVSLVYGDEDAIRQVLMNLLSNAVKFTREGSITITSTPSRRGVEPGEPPIFAEICIEDTGIGIREEDLGTIFDKFVQVDLTTVRQHEGTGLGLSIARGLVALHKGMIWATSVYEKGSRFCFTIPLSKDVLVGSREPVVEQRMAVALADYFSVPLEVFLRKPEYAGKHLRCWDYVRCGQPSCPAYGSDETRCWLILGTHCAGLKIASYPEKVDFCKGCELIENIVLKAEEAGFSPQDKSPGTASASQKVVLAIDDNPDGIDIIRKYLGDEYTVIGLLSGDDVVAKAKVLNPLAITLDILMPDKDGWQVLRELKETPETQDIPVIIVSILDERKLGFSLGAAEYIVKPVARNVLLKRMRSLERGMPITRVLVVDSEVETVRLIGNILREAGYEVLTAYNSEDAIKSIRESRPQLVILSLMMPRVSGLDVIEFLKTERDVKDTPLIVLTYREFTEQEINALNGRIEAILNKGLLKEEDLSRELKEAVVKVQRAAAHQGGESGEKRNQLPEKDTHRR